MFKLLRTKPFTLKPGSCCAGTYLRSVFNPESCSPRGYEGSIRTSHRVCTGSFDSVLIDPTSPQTEDYDVELDRMTNAITAENQALQYDNKQLNLLIKEYEQTLETLMTTFRKRAVS